MIPENPFSSQSESLDNVPHAPDVTVAERNVIEVDRKFMKDFDLDKPMPLSELEHCSPEVDGHSLLYLEPCADDTKDELSQSKFELENERHCLNGDGAEKLNADFCGDLVFSLENNIPSPSSERTSRLRSSILSATHEITEFILFVCV